MFYHRINATTERKMRLLCFQTTLLQMAIVHYQTVIFQLKLLKTSCWFLPVDEFGCLDIFQENSMTDVFNRITEFALFDCKADFEAKQFKSNAT